MTAIRSTVLSAALDYASRGWRVFPCHVAARVGFGCDAIGCSCSDGVNCDDAGKHPACAHGFLDATLDATVIRAWPLARNVAIATGEHSGLFVVDVDPRNGGGATLAKLEREHGPFPRDAVVVTGGQGLHFYYQYPRCGAPVASYGGALGQGIDLKANAGYVIAPPSLHKSGESYRWLRGMPAKLPAAPAWLLKTARACVSSRSSRADRSNRESMKTSEHATGQALAAKLGARDCGTYWDEIECHARAHKTPNAAMYPHANGGVYFPCLSSPPCSDMQVKAALRSSR
jgi:hypothetical protein